MLAESNPQFQLLKFHAPTTYPISLTADSASSVLMTPTASVLRVPDPFTSLDLTISRLKLTHRTLLVSLNALRLQHVQLNDGLKKALARKDRREALRLLKKTKSVDNTLAKRQTQVDAVGEVIEKLGETSAQAEVSTHEVKLAGEAELSVRPSRIHYENMRGIWREKIKRQCWCVSLRLQTLMPIHSSTSQILSTMELASSALSSLLTHHNLTPERVERVGDDLREALADQREVAEALDRENKAAQEEMGLDEEELEQELEELTKAQELEELDRLGEAGKPAMVPSEKTSPVVPTEHTDVASSESSAVNAESEMDMLVEQLEGIRVGKTLPVSVGQPTDSVPAGTKEENAILA
ncbi:hypothetical protein HDU93_001293 [Gonapodya sp. JEL0774]|nr:hypothetical protein HDU93_001293 [Gonapodya sp. JEL0774]